MDASFHNVVKIELEAINESSDGKTTWRSINITTKDGVTHSVTVFAVDDVKDIQIGF